MADIIIIGSVSWDEVVRLYTPLRTGSHNDGRWLGRRIGGGAANTGMALARAGDRVLLVSAVGADPDGEKLEAELARMGLDLTHLDRLAQATTRSLVMLDSEGERTIVNLARAEVPLPPDLAGFPADCFYARSADPALTPVLGELARSALVVAHVPPLKEGFRPVRVLVGSASDLDATFLTHPFTAGRQVAGDTLEWMVITYGPDGAKAFGADRVVEMKSPVVKVVDSTGAGDVFAAGLCHALASGMVMEAALETAVAWGSASVQYEGTVPPAGFPTMAEQ